MSKKKKKYKINYKKFIPAMLILVLLLVGICALVSSCSKRGGKKLSSDEGFLSSSAGNEMIQTYKIQEKIEKGFLGKVKSREVSFIEDAKIARGTKVLRINDPELDENGNVIYEQFKNENGEVFYIEPGYFVTEQSEIIQEKSMYVRTSVTLYESKDDIAISGFAKKGSELAVLGFDFVKDGFVNMYKVSCGGQEGWVFGKYLVDNQAAADAMYDENGEVAIHEDSEFSFELYGGKGLSMDYYPVEKPSFENNKIIEDARVMYLGVGCAPKIDEYLSIAKEYGINAICIDIFDDMLGFESDAAKELCPTAYEYTYYSSDSYGPAIKKIKDAGLYVIGRIVTFKDSLYAADHPEHCIVYGGTDWPSAYSREMWYYKVKVAVEAVRKFGFNEIQFDYVRFPENAYGMSKSGNANFRNSYDEDKCEVIQNFLFYACDMIHREGAYVSADVFGESAYGYVTAYGQYWPAISNVVDAISAMPYVDHFDNYPGNAYASAHPYETVFDWAERAARRQNEIPTPSIARTWITAYDAPYDAPAAERNVYGADEISSQAQALWDAGLTGGFLTWNVMNDENHYRSFSWAWAKDYAANVKH